MWSSKCYITSPVYTGSKWPSWNLNSGWSDFKDHSVYITPPSLMTPKKETVRAEKPSTPPRRETKLTLTEAYCEPGTLLSTFLSCLWIFTEKQQQQHSQCLLNACYMLGSVVRALYAVLYLNLVRAFWKKRYFCFCCYYWFCVTGQESSPERVNNLDKLVRSRIWTQAVSSRAAACSCRKMHQRVVGPHTSQMHPSYETSSLHRLGLGRSYCSPSAIPDTFPVPCEDLHLHPLYWEGVGYWAEEGGEQVFSVLGLPKWDWKSLPTKI